MYARMVTQVSRVPDFKARLMEFQKSKAEIIPGFAEVQRDTAGKELQMLRKGGGRW